MIKLVALVYLMCNNGGHIYPEKCIEYMNSCIKDHMNDPKILIYTKENRQPLLFLNCAKRGAYLK